MPYVEDIEVRSEVVVVVAAELAIEEFEGEEA